MTRIIGAIGAIVSAAVAAGTASGANPPATGTAAFQACLNAHGVTLGKTTDQTKIGAAFRACRGSAPGGGVVTGRVQLTPVQQAAVRKFTACLAKHGVKVATFGFGRPPNGVRPNVQQANGASANAPTPRRQVTAKERAAQKACASLRPKFFGVPRPQVGATTG